MSGIPAGAGQLLGKRLGKFDILALLALGGTAEIYLARIGGAAGFEKYVVVKCLHDHLADDAEFVKMFLDEARLAAHLDHSNIVQTMELGQHEGRYYMVMEFLAGLSLAMIIRRVAERLPSTRIPVPLVLNILAQSCAGLHYAHEKAMNGRALNIVHRDISPQNLVISFEGVVKVVDFGIAKAEMRETHTRSGTIKGKFAYMSPEQCVSNNVDRRTDVFALGVIGHELLTGRRLFKRPSPYETYQSVLECDVKPPSSVEPEVDPALDPVIMRALTKDRDHRYPTAEAFGDALLGYLHHRGIGSGPGDVSRFFDSYFGQELEEHSMRMRELISGREVSVDTGVTWGSDGDDDHPIGSLDSVGELGEVGGTTSRRPLAPGLDELMRRPAGALSMVLDDLGTGARADDDEMPAERTRIESNPLDRISELDRMALSKPKRKSRSSRQPPSSPAAAEPPSSAGPEQAGRPAADDPPPLFSSKLSGLSSPGRFPDLANVPTVVAGESAADLATTTAGTPIADSGFANLPTHIVTPPVGALNAADMPGGPGGIPPAMSAFANAPTGLADLPGPPAIPPAAPGFGNAPTAPAPPPGSYAGAATPLVPRSHPELATQIAPIPTPDGPRPINGGHVPPWQPARQVHQPPIAPGYPVLNAELSAQIATGATVFPSDNRASSPVHPGTRNDASASDSFPNLDTAILPDRAFIAPVMGQVGPGMPLPDPSAQLGDPLRAAHLLSPVGQQYPDGVDWSAAAAAPTRVVPPWLLLLLFVGTLGVALGITIAVAKLIS